MKATIIQKYAFKPTGQYRDVCPECSPARKKKGRKDLSVGVKDDGSVVWMCQHCGWADGGIIEENQNVVKFSPPPPNKNLSNQAIEFLGKRGLSTDTLAVADVFSRNQYIRDVGEMLCVGFPYHDESNKIYAVKYRSVEGKHFKQEGAARTFCGIERVKIGEPIVICEGELDYLSLLEAGVAANPISVPNGAPLAVKDGKIDPSEDKKFAYVWDAREKLLAAEKIILACDGDSQGEALAEELARRCDKAKCYKVTWPDGCKDANDVLINLGKAALANAIDEAEPFPIFGLHSADSYREQIEVLYSKGQGKGLSTGFEQLDNLFTIAPKNLYLITGVPSHGKSEFADQLMFNLSKLHGWKHIVVSFENPPAHHVIKLIEKWGDGNTAKPFYDGDTPRLSAEERDRAIEWVNDHFIFVEQGEINSTIDNILEIASAGAMRGCKNLIIDPFNYIINENKKTSEASAINEMLTKVRNWAARYDASVMFIAHPAKMYRQNDGNYPRVDGWSIAGSASWFAKSDVGITVRKDENTLLTEITTWKMRWKWLGRLGSIDLKYNIVTGTYEETEQEEFEAVEI
jgi:twinkle protein